MAERNGSAVADALRRAHWRLQYSAHRQVAARINEVRADVLVDLMYYKNRMEVLAMRPAPLQINVCAHPGTTGAEYVDWIVTDKRTAPAEMSADYAEALMLMPHNWLPNPHRLSFAGVPRVVETARRREARRRGRQEAGLAADAFVLASFNSGHKLEPRSFGAWMRVLRTHAHAVLWVVRMDDESIDAIKREAVRAGVDAQRIVPAPVKDWAVRRSALFAPFPSSRASCRALRLCRRIRSVCISPTSLSTRSHTMRMQRRWIRCGARCRCSALTAWPRRRGSRRRSWQQPGSAF